MLRLKKKKTLGSLLPGESRLSDCFWMEDEAREGSVEESTWCGTRKGDGIMESPGISAKQGEVRTSVTQEGQERASRGPGFRHLHLKLVLLSSSGDNPSGSGCAAGIGSAELQLGADWMRQWQDERVSLTAYGKEGYKLDIQALRAANSERSNHSLCLGGHIQGDVAPPSPS